MERGVLGEKQFRFEDFDIWKKAASISGTLFKVADELDKQRFFRFAEQLRAATLSITNNIAEGSGSVSDADFANFLNTARRSVFEVANILILLAKDQRIDPIKVNPILKELEEESRMILAFRRALKSES
jgi:four helix bundle protein